MKEHMQKTEKLFEEAEVVAALEVLVFAYFDERKKEDEIRRQNRKSPRFVFVGDLQVKPRKQSYREDIIKSPMVGALRLAIREIGEHIWVCTKSVEVMKGVLDAAEERNPNWSSAIGSAVDHAWDGIGDVWHA